MGSLNDLDLQIFGKAESPNDLIYPDCRYIEGNSPKTIYIPRPEIMFKIMRACIDVFRVKDLWFNL